jgi:hypothetical protein
MADWITTDEASEISGYHIVYLRELIRQAKIKAQKKGGAYWVDRLSLLEYMKEAQQSGDKRHGARGKPST